MALHGVIVYNILNNDCLTGTWTNNGHKSILTENAKKFGDINHTSIIGTYVCSYIEEGGGVFKGALLITPVQHKLTYEFEWTLHENNGSGVFKFKGIGFIFEENKTAVSYIEQP